MDGSRVILYTGKGGVGKTSVASASALQAARDGLRVLLMSTDPAHSVADALAQPLGPDPVDVPVPPPDSTDTAVQPGGFLQACEVRAQREMERSWASMRDWLSRILASQGVDEIRAEELTVPPGMDELFSLVEIDRHQKSGNFDLIVVDCAPTGETLRLLGFPEVIKWWLDRVFPWNRRIMGAARPLARTLDVPLPAPQALADVERLASRLLGLNDLLRDSERSSVRLVLTPDRMVVAEARRTFTYLSLYGFSTDAVIANRVLTGSPPSSDPFIKSWRSSQEQVLTEVKEAFNPTPVLTAPWLPSEAIGTNALMRLADMLFAGVKPAEVLYRGQSREITTDSDGPVIRVPVPFTDREDVAIRRIGEDLVVNVNDQRRTIMLPAALRGSKPSGASINDGVLEIRFTEGEG